VFPARLSLLALLFATTLPAWSQTSLNTSPIPNGLTPMTPVTPITPPTNVNPALNTATPVGGIGIGGTTTQIMPGAPNPTGGASFPRTSLSASPTGIAVPGAASSATSSSVPGYSQPGTTSLPGYSSPPGTVAFPGLDPSTSPGLSTSPGAMTGGSGLGSGASGTGLSRTSP
jgi:hypothetical protein